MKKSKLFLAIPLAFVMCLANFSTAFAVTDTLVNADGSTPIQAAVTKILEMPVGTNIPASTFTFAVTPVSVDGDTATAKTDAMPKLGANKDNLVTINFTAGATALTPPLANGDAAYYVESSDIFSQVDAAFFPHAGVYVYTITENEDTNTAIDADANQELGYSQAKYTLTIYVANLPSDDVNGPGTYIDTLVTVHNLKDDGSSAGDAKVVPNPGSGNGSGNGYSQMIFTNTYTHTNGPVDLTDPETPLANPSVPSNATLTVSNTVTGTLGNKDAYFSFSIKLTPPALQKNVPVYRAYVVDSANNVVTSAGNGTIAGTDAEGPYMEFTKDVDTTFQLKDGQRLVFVNTAVGTGYDVKESPSDHDSSIVVTTNGEDTTPTLASAAANALDPLDSENQLIGESDNSAAFTNTRDMVTPTGLSIDDLPFVGLIVLSIGAMAAFIIVKSRRRRNNI